MTHAYQFAATSLAGSPAALSGFAGQVLLIVNTASACGFTPQYRGLEALYRDYRDKGFAVLGFPCNQFGQQEPGSAEDIGSFCDANYGVSFPLFDKIEVNGNGAHPLFRWLKREARGVLGTQRIKWNFTKFLVDRNGRVIARFAPNTEPDALRPHIERLLDEGRR